jgi:class 3 adenylate cyclase
MHVINADPQSDPGFFFYCLLPEWISYFLRKEREGTILFVDMSGSVWNKLADESAMWSLNIRTLHHRADKIIRLCRGRTSKTIGDCVMAYFLGEQHREDACLCAISLLETFFLLKRSYDIDGDSTVFRFPITIGVASGPLLFLKKKDPYGLAVDLAARLQRLAAPGEIVMFKDSHKIETEEVVYLTKAYQGKPEVLKIKTFGDVDVIRIATPRNAI